MFENNPARWWASEKDRMRFPRWVAELADKSPWEAWNCAKTLAFQNSGPEVESAIWKVQAKNVTEVYDMATPVPSFAMSDGGWLEQADELGSMGQGQYALRTEPMPVEKADSEQENNWSEASQEEASHSCSELAQETKDWSRTSRRLAAGESSTEEGDPLSEEAGGLLVAKRRKSPEVLRGTSPPSKAEKGTQAGEGGDEQDAGSDQSSLASPVMIPLSHVALDPVDSRGGDEGGGPPPPVDPPEDPPGECADTADSPRPLRDQNQQRAAGESIYGYYENDKGRDLRTESTCTIPDPELRKAREEPGQDEGGPVGADPPEDPPDPPGAPGAPQSAESASGAMVAHAESDAVQPLHRGATEGTHGRRRRRRGELVAPESSVIGQSSAEPESSELGPRAVAEDDAHDMPVTPPGIIKQEHFEIPTAAQAPTGGVNVSEAKTTAAAPVVKAEVESPRDKEGYPAIGRHGPQAHPEGVASTEPKMEQATPVSGDDEATDPLNKRKEESPPRDDGPKKPRTEQLVKEEAANAQPDARNPQAASGSQPPMAHEGRSEKVAQDATAKEELCRLQGEGNPTPEGWETDMWYSQFPRRPGTKLPLDECTKCRMNPPHHFGRDCKWARWFQDSAEAAEYWGWKRELAARKAAKKKQNSVPAPPGLGSPTRKGDQEKGSAENQMYINKAGNALNVPQEEAAGTLKGIETKEMGRAWAKEVPKGTLPVFRDGKLWTEEASFEGPSWETRTLADKLKETPKRSRIQEAMYNLCMWWIEHGVRCIANRMATTCLQTGCSRAGCAACMEFLQRGDEEGTKKNLEQHAAFSAHMAADMEASNTEKQKAQAYERNRGDVRKAVLVPQHLITPEDTARQARSKVQLQEMERDRQERLRQKEWLAAIVNHQRRAQGGIGRLNAVWGTDNDQCAPLRNDEMPPKTDIAEHNG